MTTMTLDAFADRLDALGPDLARWPSAEGAAGRALLARSAEARSLHTEARRLGALVARAAEAEAPNGLVFRVVADVAARRRDRLGWFGWLTGSPGRFGLAGASFCGAALAAGVALAMISGPATASANLDLGAAFEVSLLDGDL
jgi:hypothetical protein